VSPINDSARTILLAFKASNSVRAESGKGVTPSLQITDRISIAQQPVQYSAMTGEGIMGMADGGDVFPRRTGAISGPGTKTSDSIPAMLSDGEFVQRTDAVNGAGVMMGATNAKEAREKGADFMYALQDKLAKLGQKVA